MNKVKIICNQFRILYKIRVVNVHTNPLLYRALEGVAMIKITDLMIS